MTESVFRRLRSPYRCWPAALVAVAAALAASQAQAASPSLGGIAPYGAQRGTEIEVNFNGGNLADAQEILLYYPGIKVLQLEAVNETTIKTKLQIAPDCRLGIHAMRVRTATGVTNLRTFNVGALPEVAEVEPNNEFATPQKINLDSTVNGFVNNEDVDYYLVEAKKGERITAEVEGIRLGNTFFDPYLAILDAKRFELASCDDAALVWQDAVASIVAPEDGAYIVQIRESAFGGNGACTYRLHVGRFPRPTAAIPAGGKPGEAINLRWLGDALGERAEPFTVPAATAPWALLAEPFGLFAKDDKGLSPSPNVFLISELGNVLEVEPNEAAAAATAFEAPMALNGVISQDGDVDCFKFAAKKGQVYDIRVLARGIRSPLDPVMYVNRSNGAGVGANDDSGGPDAYLRFSAPEDDTYVITIKDHLGKGRADYAYRIELKPIQPELVMGLPERQQYVDVTVDVPQGNRTAFLVSANRRDFGGDLTLEMKDLPAGVTLETVPMAANQTTVPVLLTAAPGTPLSGTLVDVIGRHADPNQKIEGHLEQVTGLARGQNNILVWGHTAHRMATAVTAEAPFTINVIEPKVPLVKNGSMSLKVVATRKEGFTAPINVRMLYNPPGVGSSGDIAIAEGQTEALIPLTANGGAEVKVWKIAIMGEATVGNGRVLVSSQLANLDVAEPFLGFAFNAAAVEQGKETDLVVKVTANKPFDGEAAVQLLGLPFEATTEPLKLTKDTAELVFKVKTTAKSPAGRHKTLLCQAVVTANGEPIVHGLGPGELRIDVPLPPKPNAPAPAPMPVAVAQAPAPAREKRLTRLEQLRLDREKALKAGETKPAGQ
ncbi:MAG TPA: PPC domain-containing protein [Pirellulales bacterium]|nr:PPC domain-containing protein [Pirellulales bacterium]